MRQLRAMVGAAAQALAATRRAAEPPPNLLVGWPADGRAIPPGWRVTAAGNAYGEGNVLAHAMQMHRDERLACVPKPSDRGNKVCKHGWRSWKKRPRRHKQSGLNLFGSVQAEADTDASAGEPARAIGKSGLQRTQSGQVADGSQLPQQIGRINRRQPKIEFQPVAGRLNTHHARHGPPGHLADQCGQGQWKRNQVDRRVDGQFAVQLKP
jgi:hypothetical protein